MVPSALKLVFLAFFSVFCFAIWRPWSCEDKDLATLTPTIETLAPRILPTLPKTLPPTPHPPTIPPTRLQPPTIPPTEQATHTIPPDLSVPEIPELDSHLPSVCLLIRTYAKHYRYALAPLILSLQNAWAMHQLHIPQPVFARPKFFLVVTDPGTSLEQTIKVMLDIRNMRTDGASTGPSVFNTTYQPVLGVPPTEDWGYFNTNLALREILKSNHTCNFFVFTNGDNLFTANFFTILSPYLKNNTPVVGWNWIERYIVLEFKPDFSPGHCDLSAAMISRTHLLKTFKFPYFFNTSGYLMNSADGLFWEKAANSSNGGIMLTNTFLLIHH